MSENVTDTEIETTEFIVHSIAYDDEVGDLDDEYATYDESKSYKDDDEEEDAPYFDRETAMKYARAQARAGVTATVYQRIKTVRARVEEI